jgi:glycosyltransferase involved in cell wall biosynthesis
LTYLITGLQFGGANIGMVRVLSQLPPEEFDVTVASVARTDPDVLPLLPDHVHVVRCDIDSKHALNRLRPLVGVLKKTDVLVCSLFHATMVGTLFGRALGVPSILVWHHNTEHPNRFRPLGYRLANRLADRLLADSKAVERVLREEYGVNRNVISTLPIAGVDTERFAPEVPTENGDSKSVRIVAVGRVAEQKGYSALLECARRLGEGFKFHVGGTGVKLEEYARAAPANVEFHRKIPDGVLPSFYASADIYFQPSRWEGLCMTVIEAMACGCPVVASAVGGITESLIDGETGYLCQPADIECYCEKLRELADDTVRQEEMGQAGRTRVNEYYSAEVLGEGFLKAINTAENEQPTEAGGVSNR